jgi:hypothetical protein
MFLVEVLLIIERELRISYFKIRNEKGRRGDVVRVHLPILLGVGVCRLILRIVRRREDKEEGRGFDGIVDLYRHLHILPRILRLSELAVIHGPIHLT